MLKKTLESVEEPAYVKLYLKSILYLHDLPASKFGILLSLLKRMPYANNSKPWYIGKPIRDDIAKELNVSYSYVNNTIADFQRSQILFKEDRGYYKFNPHLFGRGEWKDIKELRLSIVFNDVGKTVNGEIIKTKNKSGE